MSCCIVSCRVYICVMTFDVMNVLWFWWNVKWFFFSVIPSHFLFCVAIVGVLCLFFSSFFLGFCFFIMLIITWLCTIYIREFPETSQTPDPPSLIIWDSMDIFIKIHKKYKLGIPQGYNLKTFFGVVQMQHIL